MISDVTLKIGMNWICREKKVINGTTMKFIFLPMGLIESISKTFIHIMLLLIRYFKHPFINL